MKYADEIRQLVEKANKVPTGREKKIIKSIKLAIKSCAEHGNKRMTFTFPADHKKPYNIKYIIDYFHNEGFETEYELTDVLSKKALGWVQIHKITFKW